MITLNSLVGFEYTGSREYDANQLHIYKDLSAIFLVCFRKKSLNCWGDEVLPGAKQSATG